MHFEYLAEHSHFATVGDMDEHVENHIATNFYKLTKSARVLARTLQQMALAYPGACTVRIEKLAEKAGVSERTAHRAIKQLKENGILNVQNRTKKNGIKAANIFYFLPFGTSELSYRQDSERPTESKDEQATNENQSFNSLNQSLKQEELNNINNNACANENFMTKLQKELYELALFMGWGNDEQKADIAKMVLSAKIENTSEFVTARNTLKSVLSDIKNGFTNVKKSARAVFVAAHNRALGKKVDVPNDEILDFEDPVPYESHHASTYQPFYNWLEERDPVDPFKRPEPATNELDNWLLW